MKSNLIMGPDKMSSIMDGYSSYTVETIFFPSLIYECSEWVGGTYKRHYERRKE